MADGIEVARCYVTIVPSMAGSQKTIASELTGVTEPASKEAGEKAGKNFGESLAKGLKTTAAVIGGAMATATAAVAGTGKAFVDAANSTAKFGDDIQKNSAKMNMSISGFQEWTYILSRSGTSIDGMKTAMNKLTKASEEGNDAFKALGISQEDLNKMSPEETWNKTIAALQGVEDESKRTALASKLLGKGAVELAPLFNTTAEETEKMRQQVHDLGGVMSDEAVNSAANYQDEMLNVQTALTGVKNNLMSQFLPGLSTVMSGLAKVFSGQGGVEEIRSGLQSVIQNITSMAPQFFEIASVLINGLLSGFAPMIPQLVSSIFGFLQTGLLTLVSLIPQLTPVITEGLKGIGQALMTCLPVLISALIDMTKELVTWLATGDNVKNFIDGVFQIVSTIATSLADSIEVILPAIINIIGQIVDSMTSPKNVQLFIQTVLYIVGAVVVALVKALPEIGGVIVKSTANILSNLKQWGSSLVGKIGPWLASVWQGIQSWFVSLPGKLAEAFKTGKETILGWGKSAITWGSDMIKNFINGIKKKASDLGKAIKDLAKNYISKFLHFSVPDAGPLADADKWMPDFVDLMVKGLDESAPKMQEAVSDFAGGMSANITANGTNGTLGNMSTYNGGAVTINVYGAEGQSISALAEQIAYKLESMTRRKEAVYG